MIIIITFLFGLAPLDHPVQDLSIYNVTHTQRVIRVSINGPDNNDDKSAVSRYLYGGGRESHSPLMLVASRATTAQHKKNFAIGGTVTNLLHKKK